MNDEYKVDTVDNGDGTWTLTNMGVKFTTTDKDLKEMLEPMTTSGEQLQDIAADLRAGKIYCVWQLREIDLLMSVFMPLLFADKKFIFQMAIHKVNFFYEYLDKAMPRSINGCPMFTSMRFLSGHDEARLRELVKDLFKDDPEVAD